MDYILGILVVCFILYFFLKSRNVDKKSTSTGKSYVPEDERNRRYKIIADYYNNYKPIWRPTKASEIKKDYIKLIHQWTGMVDVLGKNLIYLTKAALEKSGNYDKSVKDYLYATGPKIIIVGIISFGLLTKDKVKEVHDDFKLIRYSADKLKLNQDLKDTLDFILSSNWP